MVKRKRRNEYIPGANRRITKEAARDLGPIIERLSDEGRATPQNLVAECSDPGSPGNPYFDWDNEIAGPKWRLQQAGEYLRSITIVIDEGDNRPREFYPVRLPSGDKSYTSIDDIVQNVDMTEQVLMRAKSALLAWHAQYNYLRKVAGLSAVIAAIENEPTIREQLETTRSRQEATVKRVNASRRRH